LSASGGSHRWIGIGYISQEKADQEVVANVRCRLSGIGLFEFDFLDSKLHLVIAAEFETVGLVQRDKWSLSLR
jgi:hypothetical protein